MKLEHLNLDQLKACPVNVRKKGAKDIDDLTASIRAIGLIQPILVRPNCEGFEVVAGQRRFNALTALAAEGVAEPVPCIIMDKGDDARAIEASLAENFIRLPLDEVDQYKAFAALAAKGKNAEEIASAYGVTVRMVQQRMAIANLAPRILKAYSEGKIDGESVRALTLASKTKQQEWWKLFISDDGYAPTGRNLKAWLFGGCQIPTINALFDTEDYTGSIILDLFSDKFYFADSAEFWARQNAAIAEHREAYLAGGWKVTVLDVGEYWSPWEYVEASKEDGGSVFITCTPQGEVTFHRGYMPAAQAKKLAARKSGTAEEKAEATPVRSEITKAMTKYIGLHRHAAVQAELMHRPSIALRLSVAHMIAGSGLWNVEADPKRADSNAIADSLTAAQATTAIAEERAEIRQILGLEDKQETDTIAKMRNRWWQRRDLSSIFETLLSLEDAVVMRIMAFVMAETLQAHSDTVQTLAEQFGTDMRDWWKSDATFFELLRDKEAITEMVREVAGDEAANANITATAKVQKTIITDCLSGNRTMKAENWLPRYMEREASGYTDRYPVSLPVEADCIEDEQDEDETEAA